MGIRARTRSTTRSRLLEGLSTAEAQVLRMKHGWSEGLDEPVGQPAASLSAECRRRVMQIEDRVLSRARGEDLDDGSVKSKIIRRLRKR
jgi:hypothetical protein